MKTIIIGGGPAGMLAAISAASVGNQVTLIEKNKSLGKKMLITGKGRCNITSSLDMDEFIKNIPGNGRFLFSAFNNFTNQDIIELLDRNGLKVKNERGNRIFPVTDSAQSVIDAIIKEIKRYSNIEIRTNSEVIKILTKENEISGVKLKTGEILNATKVIIATGGKSYPLTGSDGAGYELVEELGHEIVTPRGSIVPLTADLEICQSLQGLSLRNINIQIKDTEKNKKIYDDF